MAKSVMHRHQEPLESAWVDWIAVAQDGGGQRSSVVNKAVKPSGSIKC
jgi:hypothetical protein